MALKRKPDAVPPNPDDVAKLKQEMAAAANAVNKAAAGIVAVPLPSSLGIEREWQSTVADVNKLDQAASDIEVRVLQLDPNSGRLTDVSDKVNPRDIMPEHIEGFTSSDGSVRLPRRPNGEVDNEAALDFMSQLIGVNRRLRKASAGTESTAAMKEMEALLAESDKILAKLRR